MRILLAAMALLLASCGVFNHDNGPEFFCAGSGMNATTQKLLPAYPAPDRLATVFVGGGCMGAAHTAHTVITAAHCSGANTIRIEDETWPIAGKLVHPFYDIDSETYPGPDYDLALLFVDEPLTPPYVSNLYDLAMGGYEPDVRYFCTEMFLHGRHKGVIMESPWEIHGVASHLTYEGRSAVDGDFACNGDSGGPLYVYIEDHPWFPGRHLALAGTSLALKYDRPCDAGQMIQHAAIVNYVPWIRANRR